MKRDQGFAPIVLVLALAGVAAIATTGIIITKNSGVIPKRLSNEQRTDYDQAKTDVEAFNSLLENAEGAGLDQEIIEQYIEDLKEQGLEEISTEAQIILDKNPCDALMIDIENALKLASASWSLGDETAGDRLYNWAREAFRGFVVDAALSVGATFMERPDFDLFALTPDQRKEVYEQARETFYSRALLAQQAQLFGFEDIHRKILAGEHLEPVCVQLWDVTFEQDYDAGDGFSTEEHWTIGAVMHDVAIYKNHPKIDLSDFYKAGYQKGYITIRSWWWDDDSAAAPYHASVEGSLWFEITMNYKEDVNDFWNDTIHMQTKLDLDRPDPVISWSNGHTEPTWRFFDFGGMNFDVPALYVWQRKPFTIEDEKTNEKDVYGETIKSRVRFTPTSRVKISELN